MPYTLSRRASSVRRINDTSNASDSTQTTTETTVSDEYETGQELMDRILAITSEQIKTALDMMGPSSNNEMIDAVIARQDVLEKRIDELQKRLDVMQEALDSQQSSACEDSQHQSQVKQAIDAIQKRVDLLETVPTISTSTRKAPLRKGKKDTTIHLTI